MIQTYSSTIRRKEMDAVLTCMVDERIGPGELNTRLIQQTKDFFKCDGSVALRSPSLALKYALQAMDIQKGSKVMISALAPSWQYIALKDMEMIPLVLDVDENTGLVTIPNIREGLIDGGKVLLLHETSGILPDANELLDLKIPIIEDVSESAGASFVFKSEETGNSSENAQVSDRRAGSVGTYSILGLEERDVLTAGGGAILFTSGRREWIVLKKLIESAPTTDLLPDINCALALVQMKEFERNEQSRKEIFAMYQRSCMSGHNKMFIRDLENGSTMSSFPLILNSPYKDVKQYTARKDIEITLAFEHSVISYLIEIERKNAELGEELDGTDEINTEKLRQAKSIMLRCVHIPMYSRLTHSEVAKIVKVLGTLP
ncbi:MAG: DegT/DnrJ/EryC1/StrS family aminotransferase [Treponema sp.]|nr:DegT/DnrJ/EryC1/StrS family aminotransferase [Treponema sp.]